MMKITFISFALAATFSAPSPALAAGNGKAMAMHDFIEGEAIVGAIRWDAWYSEGSVAKAVEASLGQPKYHFRLPWFARVMGEGRVSVNGASIVG